VRTEAGEDPEGVATDMALGWESKVSVRRDDFSVTPDLLFKVFAMEKPSGEEPGIGGFELNNGDYAVVALVDVSAGDLDDITIIEKQSIKSSLGASYGGTDYASYLSSLEEGAVVEKM
jgi:peptidyl-prolyl cis-trans isomerase D